MQESTASSFEPNDPATIDDPFPVYKALRDQDPIQHLDGLSMIASLEALGRLSEELVGSQIGVPAAASSATRRRDDEEEGG